MNKATFFGRIVEVSDPRLFEKNGDTYEYRTVIFNIADPDSGYHAVPGNIIAANLWDDRELPSKGVLTRFSVRLTSERNRKSPDIYFHKVNLQNVEAL